MNALPADSLIARRLSAQSLLKRPARLRVLAAAGMCAVAALSILVVLAASQTAAAAPSHGHGASPDRGMQPESFGPAGSTPQLSAFEAADRARGEYGGRVLNVMLEHGPAGPYYRVKLLDGGRVRVVHVNAGH